MMWWICLCAAAWLTDFGWQTNDRGEVEYIVQIEPDLLEDLRRGEEIVSEIPPELTNVRRVRIRVGTGAVPRGNADAAAGKAPASPLAGLPAPPSSNSDSAPPPTGNADENEMEPPPLLPRGGAFEPPPATPTRQDSRGGAFESPPAAPDNSEPRGGAFPIERNDATKLQPIPRAPGAKSLTERLSEKLDASSSPESPMRPASHVEPTSSADNSSSPSRVGSRSEEGVEPSTKESHAVPISRTDKKASPVTEQNEVTDGTSPRRSVAVSPSRRPKSKPASTSSETSRPWGTLFVTSLLLFASIGLNIYLGWVTFGAVQRYRELARESAPA